MSEISGRTSVVFDCMVYLQGVSRPGGPAGACFDLVRIGKIKLFSSNDIFDEVRGVLDNPKFRRQFKLLTDEMVEQFLSDVRVISAKISPVNVYVELPRDVKDEKYLNLAIESNADYLISRDRDLLDLMTDFSDEAKEFRQKYRMLKIITPDQFLQILKKV